MRRIALAAGLACSGLLPAAATAQSMPGMDMSGHGAHQHAPAAPKPPAARKPARPRPIQPPAQAPTAPSARHDHLNHGAADTPDHAAMPGMDHGTMPAMPTMDHGAPPGTAGPASVLDRGTVGPAEGDALVGTALPAGGRPAPAPPADHYADRTYGADAMAASRAALSADHGGGTFSQILVNIAEYQARKRGDGYRWDGEAWFGGDIDRLTVKSEGEGLVAGSAERIEVQALYSRALDPYWNLQAGVRHDIRPRPSRTYATIGVEGLAPYWFEVEAALFISDKGDVSARIEAWHDMRLTQRLILQPRAEVDLAAQDVPADRIGSGVSKAELDLRLRYEIRREFAPYIGMSRERRFGDTARFARIAGERGDATSIVLGVRTWF